MLALEMAPERKNGWEHFVDHTYHRRELDCDSSILSNTGVPGVLGPCCIQHWIRAGGTSPWGKRVRELLILGDQTL